jgi:hypothetical protein
VNAIVRTLIVWLTLLAVPFQGFASAAMLPCAPAAPAPALHAVHEHHHMHATTAQQRDDVTHGHHDHAGKHAGHHSKCGNCAACCVGAAIAPPPMAVGSPNGAPERAIPFHAGHVPSVDLDLPERPPRIALA